MIYLMQHGEAHSKKENPDRPLTQLGTNNTEKAAEQVKAVKAQRVVHSGKLRAQQTAEIMAQALGVPCQVQAGLGPNDPVEPIAEWLRTNDETLIVGHLPFLSKLCSYLVIQDEETPIINFRNAGIVCLNQGRLDWALVPSLGG